MVNHRQVDAVLVARFQAGHHNAFDSLVTKYKSRLLRVVSRVIHNRADAEDVVQETFLRAFRALPQFRGEAAFFSWLFQIGINVAFNFKKRQTAKADISAQINVENDENLDHHLAPVDYSTPADCLETKQLLQAVDCILHSLPPNLSSALLLSGIEGMSYEEVAQSMHCPIGTVRSRVFRAREIIARELGWRYDSNRREEAAP